MSTLAMQRSHDREGTRLGRPGEMVRRLLLVSGILSSLLYVFMNVFFATQWEGYEVLAAGGGTLTDTLHIVSSMTAVLLMMLAIGFGAAALGRRFRIYSIVTIVTLVAFGVLTGLDGPGVSANQPTPWIGVWERINIGVFLLWVVAMAVTLRRVQPRVRRLLARGDPAV